MKILFKIKNQTLTTSLITKDVKEELNNTNIIDTKELVFSKKYIEQNSDLVSSFLNVVILKNNINKFKVSNKEISPIIVNLINQIPNIKHLTFSFKDTINYEIFVPLLDNIYLEEIDLFDIPIYLLERLDLHKQIKINVKNEVFFISDFMEYNNLSSFSDIYYKKKITINNSLIDNEYNDFLDFIKINYYMKNIRITKFTEQTIEEVFKLLIQNNKRNVKITINEKDNDITYIHKSLDKITKDYSNFIKNNNIQIGINYSMEFKKNHLLKHVNLTLLKIILLSITGLILTLTIINYVKNHYQTQEILDIENDIQEIVDNNQEENDEEEEETTTKKRVPGTYYTKYNKIFSELLKINDDTVAYLKINNTRIDYPVVRATNNEYYLNRDFKKNRNSLGWIFMDYRNDVSTLSDNTIIYGHNIRGGIMFGSLSNAFKSSWYKSKNNRTISLKTLYDDLEFEIFSIYKVKVTTDYISTDFNSLDNKVKFFEKMKERSIYDFKTKFNEDDKILTLSTCLNSGKERQVVHAKLKRSS